MSVAFANAVAAGLRHNGVTVRFEPNWDRRGNGQTSAYIGLSWHHTATGYGRAPRILINGRSDLSGPLCNSSGDDDGGITIIAAHPANHAGASGGRSMGPLPTTRNFNRLMWGHEIVYPGSKPMTPAQYRSACILAGVIAGILKRRDPECARGHAETSITGKWDPGYAPNRTINLPKMRGDVWSALHSPLPVPADVKPPPPPVRHVRFGEDHEMHVYSTEPNPGSAKNTWPRRTVTYGFVPGDTEALHLEWGSRGGWLHMARWWIRDKDWSPNTPKHHPQDHPIGQGGSERFIGYGWVPSPPAGADCLELTFSAPDGLHIVPAAK